MVCPPAHRQASPLLFDERNTERPFEVESAVSEEMSEATGEQKLALKIARFSGKAEDWLSWKMKFQAALELGELSRPEAGTSTN